MKFKKVTFLRKKKKSENQQFSVIDAGPILYSRYVSHFIATIFYKWSL